MRLAANMMQVQRQIQAKKAMASASLSSSQYRPPPGSHRMVRASTEVAASLCVSWCLLALQSAGTWAGRPQLSPRQARPRPTSGNEVRGQPHPTHRALPPWALHPMAPPSRLRTLLSPGHPRALFPCLLLLVVADPMTWNVRDTMTWLGCLNLAQYQEPFAKNEISGG